MGKTKIKNNKPTAKKKSVSVRKRKNILLYNRLGETRIYLILSFLLPFLIIWGFFAYNNIHPFGDKQILVTDLWHQYYPFFKVEHEKLKSFSSLLYSWDTGMGTNFISLMSYYAASPLNLLSVLFPLENSRDALTLFLTIKIGCAGVFFAIFAKNTFGRNDISITAFALCYALSDYIMGYYWNIIWIDTVALLPLVVLGTIKLYREGKYKLYIISLVLSLVSSFYIGLFTCIFTVMVFAGLVIIDWGGFKKAFKRLGQIAGATVISLGLGAFILIPAYKGLMLTVSVNNQFPQDISYYEGWLKMISAATGFHEPTAKEGLPNFYCGMIPVVLLGGLITLPKVKLREMFVTIIYLAFIVVSCNMNVLNYMWHGFHFTNMLPYRFSFLFSFILLASGYRVYTLLKEDGRIIDIIALAVTATSILLMSYSYQNKKAIIYSAAVCAAFIIAMLIYKTKIINATVLNYLVFAVCTVEMAMNAGIGVKTVSVTDYVSYPRKKEEINSLIESIEADDKDFFRIETTSNYTINDPALYGYKGISQFSSTANVNVTNLMRDMGIEASDIGNRYYYIQNTAVLNMFLNLKYIISTDNYSGDLTYLEPSAQSGTVAMYTNNHWLPLGFAAENSIIDYEGESKNQFENQNELFRLATGIEDDVLVKLDIKDVGHNGLNVMKSGYGNYTFQTNKSSDESSTDRYLKYNYTAVTDGPVYATFDFGDNVSSVKIKSGDTVLHTHNSGNYPDIFAAGDFIAGNTITLQADIEDEDATGSGNIYVYQIDKTVFDKGWQKLLAGGMNINDYGDTYINGSLTAENDSMVYTSIPYDGGWKVYVDGKKTEVKSLKNAFVCFPVSSGEHNIKMKYSPPGFIVGVITTILSLGVFILLWIYEPKIKAYLKSKIKVKVPEKSEPEEVMPEESENAQS